MFKPAQPMTNAERQRKFRARHPGYRNRFRHVYRAPVEDVAADPAVPASPATAPVDPTAMLAAALRLAQTNAASTDRLPADADTHVALASA